MVLTWPGGEQVKIDPEIARHEAFIDAVLRQLPDRVLLDLNPKLVRRAFK